MAVLEAKQLNVRFGEHHAVRDVSLSGSSCHRVGTV